MLDVRVTATCCDRCAGGGNAADACRIARRRLLKAAVFRPTARLRPGQPAAKGKSGAPDSPELPGQATGQGPGEPTDALPAGDQAAPDARPDDDATEALPRSVTGRVLDASPHLIVLGDAAGEQRFTLSAKSTAWCGGPVDPSALQPGDLAVIRLHRELRGVADRVWANIARVTGIIARRERNTLFVDTGHLREHQEVVIPARALGRVQVRFPNLNPGYLIDILGVRQGTVLEGIQPATSQPPYRSDHVPEPALLSGHFPETISGSATWQNDPAEPPGILGAAYPAIDPASGCAAEAAGLARGFRTLPYLAVGSVLKIRNDCTGYSCDVPVTACAPMARLFNDRCLQCGTTDRGRVAELTVASFVALGGELDQGCFNATVSVGR